MSNIPEDIIYYVILDFLYPRKNDCRYRSSFYPIIDKRSREIMNRKENCSLRGHTKFGKRIWCSVHNEDEYKIVNYINKDINSNRVWLFPNGHYHELIEYHPFLINPV